MIRSGFDTILTDAIMIEYNIKQKTDEEDYPVFVENISSDDENNVTAAELEE